MRSFRSKPVGWRKESHRHYLAAKGISTSKNKPKKYYAYAPTYVAGDLPLIAGDAVGTAGASVVELAPLAGPVLFAVVGLKIAANAKQKKDKTGSYFVHKKDAMLKGDLEVNKQVTTRPGVMKTVKGIPIVAEKVEVGRVYPVAPEDVKKQLENSPDEHLKGLSEVRFTDPKDKEQEQAWAQYVRSKKTILIFSQPAEDGMVDGQDPEMVNKHIRDYVLPHELGHHRALHIHKITDKKIEMAEARANANVVGMDPDDKDVKLLQPA